MYFSITYNRKLISRENFSFKNPKKGIACVRKKTEVHLQMPDTKATGPEMVNCHCHEIIP
jgi:hypothetical protein